MAMIAIRLVAIIQNRANADEQPRIIVREEFVSENERPEYVVQIIAHISVARIEGKNFHEIDVSDIVHDDARSASISATARALPTFRARR